MLAIALDEETPPPEAPTLVDTDTREWRIAMLLVEKMREVRFGEISVKMRGGIAHMLVCTEHVVIE